MTPVSMTMSVGKFHKDSILDEVIIGNQWLMRKDQFSPGVMPPINYLTPIPDGLL